MMENKEVVFALKIVMLFSFLVEVLLFLLRLIYIGVFARRFWKCDAMRYVFKSRVCTYPGFENTQRFKK